MVIKYAIKISWISPQGKEVAVETLANGAGQLKEVIEAVCSSQESIIKK